MKFSHISDYQEHRQKISKYLQILLARYKIKDIIVN
jgi:hypothetical protein